MFTGDMLVKLYDLDDLRQFLSRPNKEGISIRKPLGGEKKTVTRWVSGRFGESWVSEVETALMASPRSCFLALYGDQIIGFCCYDATALGYCGPIGVVKTHRTKGIGTALLMSSLLEMKSKGYGYAVIGWVNEKRHEFYRKSVNAIPIPDSSPGLYTNYLGTSEKLD